MNKNISLLVAVLVLNTGCKICQLNESNESEVKRFLMNMDIIKHWEEGVDGHILMVDDYRNALYYLSDVTGINTKADYSSTMGYSNKDDYRADIRLWRKWLNKNKCQLTQSFVDSIIGKK